VGVCFDEEKKMGRIGDGWMVGWRARNSRIDQSRSGTKGR
jgi:hypothetical protein